MILRVALLRVYFSGQLRAEEMKSAVFHRPYSSSPTFCSTEEVFFLFFYLSLSTVHVTAVHQTCHFPRVQENIVSGTFITFRISYFEDKWTSSAVSRCHSEKTPYVPPCSCFSEDESSGCSLVGPFLP